MHSIKKFSFLDFQILVILSSLNLVIGGLKWEIEEKSEN